MVEKNLEIVPKHIGIIMDGNRRWARKRGLKDIEGHRAGAENLSKIVDIAAFYGVETVTVYALSTENLTHRTKIEIKQLFELFLDAINRHLADMQKKGVRVSFIGEINSLPFTLRRAIRKCINVFIRNERIKVNIALNYGGRLEIVRAVQEMIKEGIRPTEVDEEQIAKRLYTHQKGQDPDLIIRTGGQVRLSNFLLWQASYSEFYFTDTLWPDFDGKEFKKALIEYERRKRNFGA